MSIASIQNAMRLQALRAAGHKITSRYGIAHNYNPNRYTMKARIQPEGVETGFLPIAASWVGNGWGMFAPPTDGDQVVVTFIDGDLSAGYIESVAFNSQNNPLACPQGEFWLVHKSGAFFKLLNSGAVTFSDGQGASIECDGSGNIITGAKQWTHTGPFTVDGNAFITGTVAITGNVTVSETLTATTDVVGGGKSLKTHEHAGVTTGSGTSGPPV